MQAEPLEAARLDYASTLQVHAYIALPMLKVPIMSLVFIKMVESLRSFDLIYVMTKGGPGIATDFRVMVEDYIERRFGAGARTSSG